MFFFSPQPAIVYQTEVFSVQPECSEYFTTAFSILPRREPEIHGKRSDRIPHIDFHFSWLVYDIFFHGSSHLLCIYLFPCKVPYSVVLEADQNPWGNVFVQFPFFFFLIACPLYAVKYENYFCNESSFCDKMLTPSSVPVNDRPFIN